MRNGIDFRRADCYFSVDKKRFIQNHALDDFAYDLKLQSTKVSEVVNYALHVGIFDKNKFKEFGVLTSEEIQKNYKIATYKRINQWHNTKLCYKSLLQNSKTDDGNNKTDDGNNKNDSELEREKSKVELQSKVDIKKEKQKETSENQIDETSLTHLKNLSSKLNKTLNHKGLSKVDFQNIDFQKLEKAVNESEFLQTSNNLTINWLLLHYNEIINGNYKDFHKSTTKKNDKAIITRNYTKEELDSAFFELGDWW